MLDRQHGNIVFECDVCGETLDSDTRDFNEALRILKNESWSARKIGVDWCHSCSDCGVAGERAPLARNGRML